MATATVNSMLLSSENPDALAEWYGAVFNAPVYREMSPYAVVDLDGFFVMFDRRDDVTGPNRDGARAILNVEPDDPAAVAARIDELGGTWVSPLENRDGHLFATAQDPDGNWIQLIRLSDEAEAEMGAPTTPFCGIAVRDIEQAASFYREVLGMRVLPTEMGTAWLRIDRRTTVLLYPKPDHVPAAHTVLNLPVTDVEGAVADLAAKGVDFLRYDGFPQDEHGIMRGHGPDIAWFTDPSGNVVSVLAAGPPPQ
ncbi:VOC family protein [Rhodococcoides corynebacterioides]|uniref:VOC family protein n=1 Tax=Rhodococcoides corynebacterioides TaxID=53972 RepID=A0ABS7P8E4_9NOCA|nr:VOC family protein [Rhodococcus corynebacterioides]MBY6368689.1 VOC family protein [Rhodococcus corynebacterioides]MBY6409728.1 VOC family protein [Rhodococcus corynebacterioides]